MTAGGKSQQPEVIPWEEMSSKAKAEARNKFPNKASRKIPPTADIRVLDDTIKIEAAKDAARTPKKAAPVYPGVQVKNPIPPPPKARAKDHVQGQPGLSEMEEGAVRTIHSYIKRSGAPQS